MCTLATFARSLRLLATATEALHALHAFLSSDRSPPPPPWTKLKIDTKRPGSPRKVANCGQSGKAERKQRHRDRPQIFYRNGKEDLIYIRLHGLQGAESHIQTRRLLNTTLQLKLVFTTERRRPIQHLSKPRPATCSHDLVRLCSFDKPDISLRLT